MKVKCENCEKEFELDDFLSLSASIMGQKKLCDICKLGETQVEVPQTTDELLETLFPQPADNTIEWLGYCLSPYQQAIIVAMLELNRSDVEDDKQASYNQRIQRMWQSMLKADDKEVNDNNLQSARKFVEEHQIW